MLAEVTASQPDFLGQAIQHLRKQKKLSARALSLKSGLSPAYVFKVEKGAIEPSFRSFCKIAKTLGMSPAEIWVCVASESID